MKVFISWSKPRSREAANILKHWLKEVLPEIEPWISDEDISVGAHLPDELRKGLEGARFAVICMTIENTEESWLIFEAGAIANGVGDTARVCPFFIDYDLSSASLPPPLENLVYAKSYHETDTLRLLISINNSLEPERRLSQDDLKTSFYSKWLKLDDRLQQIRNSAPLPPRKPQETVKHYEQLVDEFDHIRRSFEVQRRLLIRELYPLVLKTVLKHTQNNNTLDLEDIIDKAYEAVERVREEFNFNTELVGNVRDFLKRRFTREHLKDIIEHKLQPILKRSFIASDDVVEVTERIVEITDRAELEGVNVFYKLYRVIAEELAESILEQRT